MKLLVTGGTGLLGSAVLAAAPSRDMFATFHHARGTRPGVTWLPLDLRDPQAPAAVVREAKPDVVVHTAIAIAPGDLLPVIVEGSEHVARAAHDAGAALIHLSSDMVFDGRSGPFAESDLPSPITPYGRAKARAGAASGHMCGWRSARCCAMASESQTMASPSYKHGTSLDGKNG